MTPLTICLIICALTMVSYVLNKIPMALTALLSMVAFILTGCLGPQTALGYFGNSNGVMIVAMFVVAAGFTRTQFVKKAAASVNKIAHGSLMMVMLGYVLVTALLAQFIHDPHGHPRRPHVHGQRRLRHPLPHQAVPPARRHPVYCQRGLDHDRVPHVLSGKTSNTNCLPAERRGGKRIRRYAICWRSSSFPAI